MPPPEKRKGAFIVRYEETFRRKVSETPSWSASLRRRAISWRSRPMKSLFNPRLSTPQEMAPVIVANMGEDKWRRLIVETDAAYKLKRETAAAAFKRKRQTPAG